jgi:hypothetical protein
MNGYIYISINKGLAWQQRAMTEEWSSISISSQGTVMAAATLHDGIFISRNHGLTWTVSSSFAMTAKWTGVSLNYAGTQLVATAQGLGVFKSTIF